MSKKIIIKTCNDCIYVKRKRDYTSDIFEFCERFDCTLSKKNIERFVDWYQKEVPIPLWCELENN